MSQGRPSNPSKGTQRPGEKRPPGADQGNKPKQASPSPQSGPPPKEPTPGPATAGQAAAGGKPSTGGPAAAGSTGTTPPSPAATGIPQVNRPPASASPAAASSASAKPGGSTPASGGRPPSGGSGSGSSGGPSSSGGGGSSGARSTPPPPPPAPPPAKSGGGYVAGLVGGVVGAALATFGGPMLMGPPPLAPESASRLASVEASVDDLQTLSSTLEPTVQSAVEAAVAEVPSSDGAAIAAVAEQLETVSGEVTTLTAAAAAFDPAEQGEQLASLGTTLTELQAQLTSEAQRLDDARAAAVATLEEQLAGQAEQTANVGAAASAEIADAKAALTAELETVRGTIQSATDTVAAMQSQVDALAGAEKRAAAAALLARDIDRSIADGSPFAEPLGRLVEMSAGDTELDQTLSELQPFAESGVPTVQALRQSLEAVAETDTTEDIAGYEWLGQTVDNLTDLVAVRAKDTGTDVATGDLLAADEALSAGDLARAIATVEEAAAIEGGIDPAAAEAWLVDAKARQTAVTAQSQLDTHIRELLTATVN